MPEYTFTVPLTITVQHDCKPNIDSIVDAAIKAVRVGLDYESSENITDTGAEITAISIDWDKITP